MRRLISSGSPYEPRVGISRCSRGAHRRRVGHRAARTRWQAVGQGNAAVHARRCLEIIQEGL
jgi:hypothetical protein